MEIRLPSARHISGRVLGPGGEGVAGVRITAQPVSGPAFAWYLDRFQTEHSTATTGADGAFDLGGLGDFTYRVTFSALPDFAPLDARVVKAGTRDDTHFVSGVDLMPTFLELTSVQGPEKLDGHSMLPLLKGTSQDDREFVFTQIFTVVLP